MDKKLTRRAVIAKARAEIRALPQPKGVRWDVWIRVQHVLAALAGHLPDVWPSLDRLAVELGWHKTSVHRSVSKAVALGFVSKNIRSRDKHQWDSTEYLLTCLSDACKADVVRLRPEHTSVHSSGHTSVLKEGLLSTREDGVVPSPSGRFTPGAACGGADQTAREAEVPRYDPDNDSRNDPEAYGAPHDPLPVHAVKPLDPATRLAALFDDVWKRAASKHAHLRMIKPSHRPRTIQWLSGVMLRQVDEDVAEAYIRQFPRLVVDGAISIGPKQTAFQVFTGTWGTVEEIDDPVTSAEDRARAAANLERYREYVRQVDDAAE